MRPRVLTWPIRLAALAALALLALLAATPRATAAPAGDLAADIAGEDEEPPPTAVQIAGPAIAEVLAAAYRAAGLDRAPARGWIRRARVAGLVPWVTVRTGRNTSWQDVDPQVDRGTTLEVRATWRLDRLMFDGRELQVASIEAARRRERRQLAGNVIRAYYHWRRMAGAAALQPRWTLRAEEAAAELDALTDGWFSGQLGGGRQRTPARSR
jgi:hypothetical protein